jgi:DNA modification methylase
MIDLRQGDCVERAREIPDASIDLVLTSPPYDNLRRYSSGSAFDFEALAWQLKRVLKPGGVLVWVVGDQTIDGSETGTSFKQALHFKAIGLNLHDTMIYAKSNPVPLNHNRYEQEFEFMFVLSEGKPMTVNKLTESCKHAGKFEGSRRHRRDGAEKDPLSLMSGAGELIKETKPRGNIWFYLAGGHHCPDHPAVFPLQLAIDHILSWTNPGDTVLDPFVGSGTVGEACLGLNRNFIGIDISPEYLEIAKRRINQASGVSSSALVPVSYDKAGRGKPDCRDNWLLPLC